MLVAAAFFAGRASMTHRDATVAEHLQQLLSNQLRERERLSEYYLPAHPDLVRLDENISSIQNELKDSAPTDGGS